MSKSNPEQREFKRVLLCHSCGKKHGSNSFECFYCGSLVTEISPPNDAREVLSEALPESEVNLLRKALLRADRTCENMHHDKHERHDDSNCPVEKWVNAALNTTGDKNV